MAVEGKKASRAGRPRKDAGQSVREDLLAAAVRLLREKNLEELTLRKVAAAAGVSHVATYHHFENKNALLAAVAEEGYGRFFQAYNRELNREEEQAEPGRTPELEFEARFRGLGWAYILFILENAQQARLMFGPSSMLLNDNPHLKPLSTRAYRRLYRIIRMGQAIGAVAPGHARRKTLAAWSMIHGMAMLLMEERLPPEPTMDETREMVWSITDYAYYGMRGGAPDETSRQT